MSNSLSSFSWDALRNPSLLMSLVYEVALDRGERGNRNDGVGVAACYFVRVVKKIRVTLEPKGHWK